MRVCFRICFWRPENVVGNLWSYSPECRFMRLVRTEYESDNLSDEFSCVADNYRADTIGNRKRFDAAVGSGWAQLNEIEIRC